LIGSGAWRGWSHLLPPQRPPTSRPNNDHRQVVEAMVWLARTGAPWRDLPSEYGSWKTVASRFYRWRRRRCGRLQVSVLAGSWEAVEAPAEADQCGGSIDITDPVQQATPAARRPGAGQMPGRGMPRHCCTWPSPRHAEARTTDFVRIALANASNAAATRRIGGVSTASS
jgi:Putative transposase of IS4/5 family (DUF4096)